MIANFTKVWHWKLWLTHHTTNGINATEPKQLFDHLKSVLETNTILGGNVQWTH